MLRRADKAHIIGKKFVMTLSVVVCLFRFHESFDDFKLRALIFYGPLIACQILI